jgi:leucyl-tRNA synthetase
MSKSLGNIISPYELIDKYGADTMRYYTGEIKPGLDMNFNWEEVKFKYKNHQGVCDVQTENPVSSTTKTDFNCLRQQASVLPCSAGMGMGFPE